MPYGKNDRWKTGFNLNQNNVLRRAGNVLPTPNDGDLNTFEIAQSGTTPVPVSGLYTGEYVSPLNDDVAITYIGDNPKTVAFLLEGYISIDIMGTNDQVALHITQNAVVIAGSMAQYTANSIGGTEYGVSFNVTGVTTVNPGDILALELAADAAGTLILVELMTSATPQW